jgi:hypothetical protein
MNSRSARRRVTVASLVSLVALALGCAGSSALWAATDLTDRITNPDFEDGLTGWPQGFDGSGMYFHQFYSSSDPDWAHSGFAALVIGTAKYGGQPHVVGDSAYVSQTVDLTDADLLTLWRQHSADSRLAQRVYVNGDLLWQSTSGTAG